MTAKNKTIGVICLLAVVTSVVYLLWVNKRINSADENASTAISEIPSKGVVELKNRSLDAVRPNERKESPGERAAKLSWHDPSGIRAALDRAIATKDPKQWEPLVGSLVNPNYRRETCIAILAELLTNSDWSVRIRAAQELTELGSDVGKPILRQALKASVAGADIPAIMVLPAARALQSSGETINEADLKGAYQRTHSSELLEIAAQEGNLWVVDVVQQKRVAHASLISTELLAVNLNMKDAASIERYNLLLTANDEAKVLGNWGLYRATGDVARLQYVVDVVRSLDGVPGLKIDASGDAGAMAVELLSSTPDPLIKEKLEEIMDAQVGKNSARGMSFTGALSSLYFVQKDYDFIDRRLLEFFRGTYPVSGSGSTLMWQIAAMRSTPEIENLALAKSPDEYDLYFIRMQGRLLKGPAAIKK